MDPSLSRVNIHKKNSHAKFQQKNSREEAAFPTLRVVKSLAVGIVLLAILLNKNQITNEIYPMIVPNHFAPHACPHCRRLIPLASTPSRMNTSISAIEWLSLDVPHRAENSKRPYQNRQASEQGETVADLQCP